MELKITDIWEMIIVVPSLINLICKYAVYTCGTNAFRGFVQLVCIERNSTNYLHMNMHVEMYRVKGHRANPVEDVRAG